jgi:hypothetical protein
VQNVLGRLLIIAEATEQEGDQHVAAAVVGPGVEDGQPVRVIAARLVVARNYSDVRRDGYRNVDLSVLKNLVWSEGRQKIQFRGEFINAFNIVVFGTPGIAVNDPANFGIVRTQGNQSRLIQLALRYTF